MINRNNYEEYFILYLDNELGEQERRMVEAFANVHSDLKEELDILLQSKLVPDQHIVFKGKEELMAYSQSSSSINLSNYEDWLLLYTDNELNTGERKRVDDFVATNPSIKRELGLLLQTKLQPEALIFSDKASLYRKEEKVRPIMWWRIAAAAAVFIAIGTSVFVLMNKDNDKAGIASPVVVAQTPAMQQPGKTTSPVKQDMVKQTEQPSIANNKVEAAASVLKKSDPVTIKKQEEKIPDNLVKKSDNPNNLPSPDQNPYYKDGINPKNTAIAQTNMPSKIDLTTSPETRNTIPVTNGVATASLQSNKSITPDVVDMDEPDGKKNKLRGFFRKVTRTFEKRTNIETTDDDDRLLVGGLAIKLK